MVFEMWRHLNRTCTGSTLLFDYSYNVIIVLFSCQYSEEVKEAAAFRVLFEGKDARQVMQELGIHCVKTIHHWVADYQQKIEQGLISLPPMNEKQKQNLKALRQRNKQLEKVLEEANLMKKAEDGSRYERKWFHFPWKRRYRNLLC